MSQYKLTYYDVQGLGEPIRYMFKIAGVEFEDNTIHKDDATYPKLPADIKDTLPWGTMPVLEVDGKKIAQSNAICRFLANRFNLAGTDEFEKAKCDEIVDAVKDFLNEYLALMSPAISDEKKKEMMQKMHEITSPFYMGKFNKIAQENDKWLVGKNLTWADIIVAHFLNKSVARVKVPFIEQYPALKKLLEDFNSLPQIKDWMAQRPYTAE